MMQKIHKIMIPNAIYQHKNLLELYYFGKTRKTKSQIKGCTWHLKGAFHELASAR